MKKLSFLPFLAIAIAIGASAFTVKTTHSAKTTDYYWFQYNGQDINGLIPGSFVDGPKAESEMTDFLCDDSGTPLCFLGYRADQVNTSGTPQVNQTNGVYQQPESEGAIIHETP